MRLLMLVCAGGALGAGVRHLANTWFAARGLAGYPWATFAINVTGSALMGIVVALLTARTTPSPELRAFIATGILGGYTTFSSFSLEAWQLIERGEPAAAAIYVAGSVALGLVALIAALHLTRLVLT